MTAPDGGACIKCFIQYSICALAQRTTDKATRPSNSLKTSHPISIHMRVSCDPIARRLMTAPNNQWNCVDPSRNLLFTDADYKLKSAAQTPATLHLSGVHAAEHSVMIAGGSSSGGTAAGTDDHRNVYMNKVSLHFLRCHTFIYFHAPKLASLRIADKERVFSLWLVPQVPTTWLYVHVFIFIFRIIE